MERTYSLKQSDYFFVSDDIHNWMGASAEWLDESKIKTSSSASVSATITLYLSKSCEQFQPLYPHESTLKSDLSQLMEDYTAYLKIGRFGTCSLYPFNKALLDFAKDLDVNLTTRQLDIPWLKWARPSIDQCVLFIQQALERDCPVAWLCLHHGLVSRLPSPQWLVITAMTVHPNGPIICTYLDNGKKRTADFRLWFQTTLLGGGLIYGKKP